MDTDLSERIYSATRLIPKGMVSTYGDIAVFLGSASLARHVGNVLHRNPYPGLVPCHRVVNASGFLARNFGFGGLEGQRTRLEAEGVTVTDGRVDLSRYRFHFPQNQQ